MSHIVQVDTVPTNKRVLVILCLLLGLWTFCCLKESEVTRSKSLVHWVLAMRSFKKNLNLPWFPMQSEQL